jgi:hypothetical protein
VKRSAGARPTLRFRGSPVSLDALVGIPHEHFGAASKFSVEELAPGAVPNVHASSVAQGATRLRMEIARNTVPGMYKGTAKVGDETYPVEIQVEPYVHLSVSPRQLVVDARAGQDLHEDLIVANTGNVPADIGVTYAFGLYDVQGAERGIRQAFRKTESDGRSRLDQLVDGLAEGHAGIVRLRVEDGAGPIAPGEVRAIRLDLRMPAGLQSGYTYTGTLPIHNLRYYVKVRALEAATK